MTSAHVVRVVLGDMASTTRRKVRTLLSGSSELLIVGEAGSAHDLVPLIRRLRPNLVLIGIGGGASDPFEATKLVMAETPTPLVIVDDGHDIGEVQASVLALRSGALAVAPVPGSPGAPDGEAGRRRFISTLKALSEVKLVRRWRDKAAEEKPTPAMQARSRPPGVVAIAASTGGPAALQRVLTDLPADFAIPILIVQHIALGFIDGLAQWLNTVSSVTVKIAADSEPLRPKTAYLAPDGRHLGVSSRSTIVLSDAAPVNGFRPAADYLFASAAQGFGAGVTAVVLTGMGQDGVAGLKVVRERGGEVIAQDEASSVVYGMPKAAFDAGLVDEVLPLPSIAGRLIARGQAAGKARR